MYNQEYQKHPLKVFYKKAALNINKTFPKINRKTTVMKSLFNKFAVL